MTTGSNTAVIAVTTKGLKLAKLINTEIPSKLYYPEKLGGNFTTVADCFTEIFSSYNNIIAVMAQGIVTRMIAPHMKSKYTDPAVVTCDEVGRFAISTLSGHEGGANILAHLVSSITGAQPVITTATEANRIHILGIGCRRGTGKDTVINAVKSACAEAHITLDSIRMMSSAWLKKDEAGIIEAAQELKLYLRFIPESYYKNDNYCFTAYDAPMKHFGIPGVAEPSAVLAGVNAELILKRKIYGDVTIAIAREVLAGGK
ncbi:cobalt-precorrin 5A hydrolase [Deferribacteres bacterium DY0037]